MARRRPDSKKLQREAEDLALRATFAAFPADFIPLLGQNLRPQTTGAAYQEMWMALWEKTADYRESARARFHELLREGAQAGELVRVADGEVSFTFPPIMPFFGNFSFAADKPPVVFYSEIGEVDVGISVQHAPHGAHAVVFYDVPGAGYQVDTHLQRPAFTLVKEGSFAPSVVGPELWSATRLLLDGYGRLMDAAGAQPFPGQWIVQFHGVDDMSEFHALMRHLGWDHQQIEAWTDHRERPRWRYAISPR